MFEIEMGYYPFHFNGKGYICLCQANQTEPAKAVKEMGYFVAKRLQLCDC